MTFVLYFTPFMIKLMVQHTGDTFLTLTKFQLSYQTYHFEIVPFSMKGVYLCYLVLVNLPE